MTDIIVGADGSEASNRALAWALKEARLHEQATLTVVHAYRPPDPTRPNGASYSYLPAGALERMAEQDRLARAEQEDRARHRAEAMLRHILEDVDGGTDGVVIKQVIVARDPAKTLVELSQGADLLVVGSRGRGGFKGLLLGSVSQQCVHHAACAVVVIR